VSRPAIRASIRRREKWRRRILRHTVGGITQESLQQHREERRLCLTRLVTRQLTNGDWEGRSVSKNKYLFFETLSGLRTLEQ